MLDYCGIQQFIDTTLIYFTPLFIFMMLQKIIFPQTFSAKNLAISLNNK